MRRERWDDASIGCFRGGDAIACDRLPAKVSAHRPVSAAMRPDAIGSHRLTSMSFSEREFPLDISFSVREYMLWR
jgi:hypothetical protein